jgi:hypothetical protein
MAHIGNISILSTRSIDYSRTYKETLLISSVRNAKICYDPISHWQIISQKVYATDEAFSVAGTKSPARIQGLDLKEINLI